MSVRTGDDGRKVYCSGLLDSDRLDSIFARGLDSRSATIKHAYRGKYSKGPGSESGLHIDVTDEGGETSGVWYTEKSDIKSIFQEIAGIRRFPFCYRLSGLRVLGKYADEIFVGISPLKKESEPVSQGP